MCTVYFGFSFLLEDLCTKTYCMVCRGCFFLLHMHICVWVKRRGLLGCGVWCAAVRVRLCVGAVRVCVCVCVCVCVFALRSHLHQATVISALTLKAGRKFRMSLLCGRGDTTCEHFNRHPKKRLPYSPQRRYNSRNPVKL
jgi:hypothetical protein